MNLNDLAQTSYAIAVDRGWWETPRRFSAITLLMLSEISEAIEDYRTHKSLNETYWEVKFKTGNKATLTDSELAQALVDQEIVSTKPCGIPSELADVIIRIADYAGHAKLDLESRRPNLSAPGDANFEDALARASSCISKAWDAFDMGAKWHITNCLAMSAGHILATCAANNIDIEKAVEAKTAFNRSRDYRHGGKKI